MLRGTRYLEVRGSSSDSYKKFLRERFCPFVNKFTAMRLLEDDPGLILDVGIKLSILNLDDVILGEVCSSNIFFPVKSQLDEELIYAHLSG